MVYEVRFYIGRARYVVNFWNGTKTHSDGSDFFDVAIFGNKRKLAAFVKGLEKQGYSAR